MPQITVVYGFLLVLLGIGGYWGAGRTSLTALIPLLFGVPIIVSGLLARKEHLLMHGMHAASTLGLLAFLGSAIGIPKAIPLLTGGVVERPLSVVLQAVMAGLSGAFVALCIRSFIAAKKARKAAGR